MNATETVPEHVLVDGAAGHPYPGGHRGRVEIRWDGVHGEEVAPELAGCARTSMLGKIR